MSVINRVKQLFLKNWSQVKPQTSHLNEVSNKNFISVSQTTRSQDLTKEMIPTFAKCVQAYKPMIQFIGKKEALVELLKSHNYEQIKPHPCTLDGLMPGSKDCLQVDEILNKQLPFKVIPYINQNKTSTIVHASDSKYNFPARELNDNELESVFQLPKKYQYKVIDEAEIDMINNGGAY